MRRGIELVAQVRLRQSRKGRRRARARIDDPEACALPNRDVPARRIIGEELVEYPSRTGPDHEVRAEPIAERAAVATGPDTEDAVTIGIGPRLTEHAPCSVARELV